MLDDFLKNRILFQNPVVKILGWGGTRAVGETMFPGLLIGPHPGDFFSNPQERFFGLLKQARVAHLLRGDHGESLCFNLFQIFCEATRFDLLGGDFFPILPSATF